MPSSLEILSSELDQVLERVLPFASHRLGSPGWLAAEAFIVLAHAVEITDDVLAAKSLCESAEPLSHFLQDDDCERIASYNLCSSCKRVCYAC